jgi:tetratricopeptide (TPR) repeat protein
MADKRQKQVIFLSVPESLQKKITDVFFNADIPIPVEVPLGLGSDVSAEKFILEELNLEMILSGMLIVVAEGKEKNEWLDYYRHFVLTLRPNILEEFTEAAIIKARNNDFDLALEILDALRGLFPASPVVKLNRALAMEEKAKFLERHGKPDAEIAFRETEAAYEKAMAIDPIFPDACFNAGFFYLDRKEFCRARECLAMYVEANDYPADTAKQKHAKSIINEIDKNGLKDENFNNAYNLIRQGKEEAGMRSIREFIEKYPSVWNGWFVLGWALRRLGRWEDGAAAFGKAIELGSCDSDTHNELAICLMECGDLNGAGRELKAALRIESENIKIISNLGVLALKSGNTAEAASFFRAVLEIYPEDTIANRYFSEAMQALDTNTSFG